MLLRLLHEKLAIVFSIMMTVLKSKVCTQSNRSYQSHAIELTLALPPALTQQSQAFLASRTSVFTELRSCPFKAIVLVSYSVEYVYYYPFLNALFGSSTCKWLHFVGTR